MDIAAAIFDFDGTLVDSQPMWVATYTELFARHGLVLTPELDDYCRPMNLDDKCAWYHAELGMGESGEANYRELCGLAIEGYRGVDLLPDARAFLERLKAAGVPLAIASSTPETIVRAALRGYGIEDLFDQVVCAADVGRGKDFPDVYLAACARLGATPETSWVFEDAPFAVRVAHDAGFHVVGVVSEWEADDPLFVENAHIIVHGYPELSLELLRDYADGPAEAEGLLSALVVDGSPEPSSAELVARLALCSDYVIAADRGAEICREAGVAVDVFCGDADSVSAEAASWAHGRASTEIRFPSEKYATDLALAIDCACHEAARQGKALELTVTCASGGRPDHALAVLGLVARHVEASPSLVEDGYECRILSPKGVASWAFGEDAVGSTFSAIALLPGTVVSEHGTKWELDHRTLEVLGDLGVSNEVASADAEVTCHAGMVAVYLLN